MSVIAAPAPPTQHNRVRRRIGVVGDSYQAQNTSFVNGRQFLLNGNVTMLNALAKQAFTLDIDNATWTQSGSGTVYIISQLPAILANKPDFVFFNACHNDFIQGLSLATVQANLAIIMNTLKAGGITPVCCLTGPQSTNQSSGSVTLTQLQRMVVAINQWKRAFCMAKQIPIWDWHLPMVDLGASGGGYAAGMSSDTIHPGYKASLVTAQRGLIDLAQIIPPPLPAPIIDVADVYDATYNPYGNLVQNGLFWTGGGSVSAPITGTGPASWSASRTSGAFTGNTVALSLVPSSDGIGQWAQFAISGTASGGAANDKIQLSQTINAGVSTYASGDTLEAFMEVQFAASSPFKFMKLAIQDNDGVNATNRQHTAGGQASSGETAGPATAWEAVIATPRFTVAPYAGSGTQRLFIELICEFDNSSNNFAGTVRFRRVTIRKVPTI